MGVYSDRAFTEAYSGEVDLLNEDIDITGVTDVEDGGMTQLMVETEQNYARLMKVIGVSELAAIEQDGEAIYESSDVSGFFGKIKEFFKNLLEKIKRLFKNFAVKFDSWTKSNKDFITKYKKQIVTASTKDFKFDGYKFEHLDKSGISAFVTTDNIQTAIKAGGKISGTTYDDLINDDPSKIVTAVGTAVGTDNSNDDNKRTAATNLFDSIDEVYDDIQDAMRGQVAHIFVNSTDNLSFDSSEFADTLFEGFRSGEKSKTTLELSDVGGVTMLMQLLVNDSTTQSNLNKQFSANKKLIDGYTKNLDKAESNLLKETPSKSNGTYSVSSQISLSIRAVSTINRMIKDYQQYWIQAENAYMRAVKDRAAQAKSICTKLLTRKKPTNESAYYDESDFGVTHSTFDSVKFV